ncbi:hypothetical protein B0H13DRAFT_2665435 [Mycena leptocephala]|nr:hypothetical protein B0H13DRAFT_2665435 [Mycena leptocephala]
MSIFFSTSSSRAWISSTFRQVTLTFVWALQVRLGSTALIGIVVHGVAVEDGRVIMPPDAILVAWRAWLTPCGLSACRRLPLHHSWSWSRAQEQHKHPFVPSSYTLAQPDSDSSPSTKATATCASYDPGPLRNCPPINAGAEVVGNALKLARARGEGANGPISQPPALALHSGNVATFLVEPIQGEAWSLVLYCDGDDEFPLPRPHLVVGVLVPSGLDLTQPPNGPKHPSSNTRPEPSSVRQQRVERIGKRPKPSPEGGAPPAPADERGFNIVQIVN